MYCHCRSKGATYTNECIYIHMNINIHTHTLTVFSMTTRERNNSNRPRAAKTVAEMIHYIVLYLGVQLSNCSNLSIKNARSDDVINRRNTKMYCRPTNKAHISIYACMCACTYTFVKCCCFCCTCLRFSSFCFSFYSL